MSYKTELQANNADLQTILAKVNELPEAGTELPELNNPGAATDLMSGKELIDGDGNKVTGTYVPLDTSDADATAGDMLSGKTAYVDGEKVTGNIPAKTASDLSASGKTVTIPAGYYASQATKDVATAAQATPSISVNSSGLITASATQTAGYVAAGTKSATEQLTIQAAQTITPGTSNKTIASGRYLTGTQTIKGDANLKAENIKSGVSIFGVAGSLETTPDIEPGTYANVGVYGSVEYVYYSDASGRWTRAIPDFEGEYIIDVALGSVMIIKSDNAPDYIQYADMITMIDGKVYIQLGSIEPVDHVVIEFPSTNEDEL